mmetsp:Transcript_18691/g.27711  ORF Transcript_18691/g.27711 Transcript_18691/m.27711 type:complete len:107 (-) Transcript_18691:46-366(-)
MCVSVGYDAGSCFGITASCKIRSIIVRGSISGRPRNVFHGHGSSGKFGSHVWERSELWGVEDRHWKLVDDYSCYVGYNVKTKPSGNELMNRLDNQPKTSNNAKRGQ